jgi:hypothetical protein
VKIPWTNGLVIRANALMLPYVKTLKKEGPFSSAAELLRPFDRLLAKGLIKQGSAIFFRRNTKARSSRRSPAVRPPDDLTGCEHTWNRFHVEDFVQRRRERYHQTLLRHALALGVEVFDRAAALSPRSKIQVTLCFDEFRGKIAVFSFHTIREGQELWPGVESFRGQPALTVEPA